MELYDNYDRKNIIDKYNKKYSKSNRKLVENNGAVYLTNLRIIPYHNINKFSFIKNLENNFNVIESEFNNLNKKSWQISRDIKNYDVFNSMGDSWKTSCFYYEGKWSLKMKVLCPNTYRLLRNIPFIFSWACFSKLSPYTNIPPHRGETNINLTCHLGIKNLDNCHLLVDNKKKKWTKGKCIVFDDTFLHEVKNNNSKERIVLAFDFLNPNLSRNEKYYLKKTYLNILNH